MSTIDLWGRYQKYLCSVDSVGVTLDVSRMRFDQEFLDAMADPI